MIAFGPFPGNSRCEPLFPSREFRRCFFGCLACAAFVAGCGEQGPPQKVLDGRPWEIVVTGVEFKWQITDPGFDGELGTDDDFVVSPPLHVPANTATRVMLHSRDYLYTLEFPRQKLKEIAIPDLSYQLEFTSGDAHEEEFRGDQFCGYAHSALSGTMIVQSWKDYRRWQKRSYFKYKQDGSPPSPIKESVVVN